MSAPLVSRYARLAPGASVLRRAGADNGNTRFLRCSILEQRPLLPPETVFNAWQGRMARTAREEAARGMFVFALSAEGEFAGQVWLRADDTLRTTSIGRHSSCELFLPGGDDLSLRQLLVAVAGTALEPRCRLLDLRSGAGFFSVEGEPLSSVVFSGTAVFAVPGYWLVFVPTGQIVLWDQSAVNPWRTLPRQSVVAGDDWRSADDLLAMSRDDKTPVASLGSVPMFGSTPLVGASEQSVGRLVVDLGGSHQLSVRLGPRALERGLLLGRDARCLGLSLGAPDTLSRVHAVVFRDRGEVFIADAGSTNGTWLGDTEIRSAKMEPGQRFRLGSPVETWWEAAP
jgi:FHA domain